MANTQIMFKLGNTDYSNRVLSETYSVQSNLEYKEWTDANNNIHRSKLSSRVEGEFDMLFPTIEEFDSFCQTINDNMTDGLCVPGIVYDNKRHEEHDSFYFIDFEPVRMRNEDWSDRMEIFSVKIKER